MGIAGPAAKRLLDPLRSGRVRPPQYRRKKVDWYKLSFLKVVDVLNSNGSGRTQLDPSQVCSPVSLLC